MATATRRVRRGPTVAAHDLHHPGPRERHAGQLHDEARAAGAQHVGERLSPPRQQIVLSSRDDRNSGTDADARFQLPTIELHAGTELYVSVLTPPVANVAAAQTGATVDGGAFTIDAGRYGSATELALQATLQYQALGGAHANRTFTYNPRTNRFEVTDAVAVAFTLDAGALLTDLMGFTLGGPAAVTHTATSAVRLFEDVLHLCSDTLFAAQAQATVGRLQPAPPGPRSSIVAVPMLPPSATSVAFHDRTANGRPTLVLADNVNFRSLDLSLRTHDGELATIEEPFTVFIDAVAPFAA